MAGTGKRTKSEATFRPAGDLVITDLDTLRVLADPVRFRLLETMSSRPHEPWTVKEIAKVLGEPATRLYYHVNLLETKGLVVVTGSRLVSGIVEKRYQVAAERFEVDRALLSTGSADANETLHTILSTVLDSTGDDIRASIRAGIASLHADDGREPVLLTKSLERLSPARAAEFRERLRALAKEFGPDGDDDGPASVGTETTQPYGLVVAFYPYADPATPARRSRRATTKSTTTPTAEEPHR
jgi:predicted transcriptional regulator